MPGLLFWYLFVTLGKPKPMPATPEQRIFPTVKDMRDAIQKYFEQNYAYGQPGNPTFTISDLCRFIGIDKSTWNHYRNRNEFYYLCVKTQKRLVNRVKHSMPGVYRARLKAEGLNPETVFKIKDFKQHYKRPRARVTVKKRA